jgi:hypothetical protein
MTMNSEPDAREPGYPRIPLPSKDILVLRPAQHLTRVRPVGPGSDASRAR